MVLKSSAEAAAAATSSSPPHQSSAAVFANTRRNEPTPQKSHKPRSLQSLRSHLTEREFFLFSSFCRVAAAAVAAAHHPKPSANCKKSPELHLHLFPFSHPSSPPNTPSPSPSKCLQQRQQPAAKSQPPPPPTLSHPPPPPQRRTNTSASNTPKLQPAPPEGAYNSLQILNPEPRTLILNPKPKTQNPKPKTHDPKSKTKNQKPKTLNPKQTLNPNPEGSACKLRASSAKMPCANEMLSFTGNGNELRELSYRSIRANLRLFFP